MANKFSSISRKRLDECHPDLQRLMEHVLARVDISIVCGHRNKTEQNAAYDGGYSKVRWPNSRHNSMPSTAVDIIPWPTGYRATIAEWDALMEVVKEEAALLGIEIECGNDWKKFKDRPHVQLRVK